MSEPVKAKDNYLFRVEKIAQMFNLVLAIVDLGYFELISHLRAFFMYLRATFGLYILKELKLKVLFVVAP